MIKVKFEIVHHGCLVNELSQALPQLRLICPGGFIVDDSWVEEIIIIDKPTDEDIELVLTQLRQTSGIDEAKVLERTDNKAFILIKVSRLPETFCSQVVYRNRCFPLGKELQEGGVEKWEVGCVDRSQAEQLLKDLEALGELKHTSISEASWQALLA